MSAAVAQAPGELTAPWLSAALGREVTAVECEEVGSGQLGACYRLTLTGDGVPATLIAKLPSPDPGVRALIAPAYRAEVRFYRDVAGTVATRTPRCHYSAVTEDATAFVLLLEDAAPATAGDQIAGCGADRAAAAVDGLAGLHGPRWCDPALAGLPWLAGDLSAAMGEVFAPAVTTFTDRFAGVLDDADARVLHDAADAMPRWLADRSGPSGRFALLHGDYRLDNLLFPPDAGPVMVVDWQNLGLGHPLRDLAFFVGTALEPAERARHDEALAARYHAGLAAHGVTGYTADDCFRDYRACALQGPLVTVLGCAYGTRTERGDAMFLAMIRRACAMVRDLRTLDLL
ncbi:phosphotransferase family protein [Actinomadura parmotrematis]|uniref:Phosphotransferase n=1 Tax=Actinomadura parmotrematis TaxID=2864039 RepID=A0ABS7G467_9ACTN|nr:phosphotransferase [Actinomadura parmotrematis]MBW8487499.1 phosphotransferase [Actinomadura parmotrematis]